jgi:hypothetical protein
MDGRAADTGGLVRFGVEAGSAKRSIRSKVHVDGLSVV